MIGNTKITKKKISSNSCYVSSVERYMKQLMFLTSVVNVNIFQQNPKCHYWYWIFIIVMWYWPTVICMWDNMYAVQTNLLGVE